MMYEIFDSLGFNTLIYNNPYSKLRLITSLIVELKKKRKKIVYVDLDTMFTAYTKSGLIRSINIDNIKDEVYQSEFLKIYLPDEKSLISVLVDVIKSMNDSSLVIFDSINSLYGLLYNETNLGNRVEIRNLNHLVSIFLMILLKHTLSLSIPLLVTSMINKRNVEIKLPSNNRLLSIKSSVNLFVEMKDENYLSLSILSHPSKKNETIIISDNN